MNKMNVFGPDVSKGMSIDSVEAVNYLAELEKQFDIIRENGISSTALRRAAEIFWDWDYNEGIPVLVRRQFLELFWKICTPLGIREGKARGEVLAVIALDKMTKDRSRFVNFIEKMAELENADSNNNNNSILECIKNYRVIIKKSEDMRAVDEPFHLMQKQAAHALYDLLSLESFDKDMKKLEVVLFAGLFYRWLWDSISIESAQGEWIINEIYKKSESSRMDFVNFTFTVAEDSVDAVIAENVTK